ncbi:hypothetical protein GWK18_00275 [Kocuria sp. JC486]|uniref:hypothetical protein n=1 Tax=Kocuria sp. JC486 TaxID=1970736 RepID=UPI001421E861|nr:hypothetical protein [Kocuria sp. JC486]NHU84050.1 hypothetical protein [Kocuria sp. JC486]
MTPEPQKNQSPNPQAGLRTNHPAGVGSSTAPGPCGSLTGWRGTLTVWLPVVLLAAVLTSWVITGAVPLWCLAPALTVAFGLSGDPVTRLVLHLARDLEAQRRARWDLMTSKDRRPQETALATEAEPPGLPLRGGLVIGVLERVAVVVSLAMGYPSGLAVVVAVKGLARYGEFTNAHQREQFIIGTLASLLWAAAGAGLIVLFG